MHEAMSANSQRTFTTVRLTEDTHRRLDEMVVLLRGGPTRPSKSSVLIWCIEQGLKELEAQHLKESK